MDYFAEKQFFFVSRAPGLDSKTFSVVNFSGDEGVSKPYRFEVTLVSNSADLDADSLLAHPATLFLKPKKGLPIHGILESFEQLHQKDKEIFYRAVLVPRLWELTLYEGSRVFLEMTLPDIIEQTLTKTGEGKHGQPLSSKDYTLKLQGKYRKWSYVCQYQESALNFISRLMEKEGIYYYFEHDQNNEKLIITDNYLSHKDVAGLNAVNYSPPSGLDAGAQGEVATAFAMHQSRLPNKVILQDFNYRKSPPIVSGEATVSEGGVGEVYIYGEHLKGPDEAENYAKVRAEEIRCRQKVFHGESTVPELRAGHVFPMNRHYRKDFNKKYLLLDIHHEGSQAALTLAGGEREMSAEENRAYYRNSFEAIPDGIQFRPVRKTPRARFYGTINARIEAAGDGKYAELDPYGRYKVKMPFDRSDRKGQKASRWMRMAQPYAGPNEGMHFPLRKGAEVLLTFIDGDPDRPIISGAVPSADNPDRIIDKTATKNVIHTAGGNKLEFQDHEGKERILLSSPHAKTELHMGAPNSPDREAELRTQGRGLMRVVKDTYIEMGGSDAQTEKFYPDEFTQKKDGSGNPATDDWGYNVYDPKTTTNSMLYLSVKQDFKSTSRNRVENARGKHITTTGFDLSNLSAIASNIAALGDIASDKSQGFVKTSLTGYGDQSLFKSKEVIVYGDHRESVLGNKLIRIQSDRDIKVKGGRTTNVTGADNETITGKQTILVGASPAARTAGDDLMRYVGVDKNMETNVKGKYTINAKNVVINSVDTATFAQKKTYKWDSSSTSDVHGGWVFSFFAGGVFKFAVQLALSINVLMTMNVNTVNIAVSAFNFNITGMQFNIWSSMRQTSSPVALEGGFKVFLPAAGVILGIVAGLGVVGGVIGAGVAGAQAAKD